MDQQPPLKKRKTGAQEEAGQPFPFWDLIPEIQKHILSYVLEDPQRFQRALNNLRLSLVCKPFREYTTDVWIHGLHDLLPDGFICDDPVHKCIGCLDSMERMGILGGCR